MRMRNAADSARAAWPSLAIGKPSSTVAWDADDPGMPIKTDANVSDVGTTATMPIIKAKPNTGSMPNMNGKQQRQTCNTAQARENADA